MNLKPSFLNMCLYCLISWPLLGCVYCLRGYASILWLSGILVHLSKPFLKRFTNLVVEMNCAQCLCVLTPLCLGDVRRVSRILLLLLSFSFEAFFQLHEKVEIKSSKENEIPISYLAPVLCISKAESKVEESFFLASFALVTDEKRRTSRIFPWPRQVKFLRHILDS